MSYYIKQKNGPLCLDIEIDPGGMSVCWIDIIYATPFEKKEDAENFVAVRLIERYPKEEVEVVKV